MSDAKNFTGSEGEFITYEEAKSMVDKAQRKIPDGGVCALFYGKEKLQTLLKQPDCVGIRVYFAEDENGKGSLVLVGATSDTKNQYAKILDRGMPCPNYCEPPNGEF